MAYGLKYYFVDKKIVGSTSTTYTFEIHEEDYTGSSTEWTGISIDRNYEQFSLRKINYIQKSSCKGLIRVEDSSQRSVIETIAGSEIGKYKVILKRDTDTIWTGLVVPDLIEISEQNYGNQSATIVAKDIFLVGDYALSTSRTKAIDIIIDILNTMGYELDVYTFTSWVETSQPSGSDILSVSYHEERRIRKFGRTDDEVDQAISNQQALEYMLKTYGAMLRQSDGAWNIIQISAFEEPSAVRRFRYDYTKTLQSAELDYQLGAVSTGSDLKVFGSSSNNFFAGLKKVKSEFKHESTIQGIKFNRQYWFEDTDPLTKTQFWQADGTGNLEFSFVTWLARNTDGNVDLGGNTVVAEVTIQCGTYYFNGSSWAETPATIDVEVEDVFSTTDSNGYYIHKNQGISIVTDPIPNGADGQLSVTVDPKDLTLNYEYLLIRDVNFDLAYSDNAEGVSSSIRHELISDLNFSEEYDFGTYYFGSGPSEASLSAIKDSSGNLLATFKRSTESLTDTHEELLLREILDLRRTQKRSIRAVLYGEYEPISVINYDSQRFFFFGGTWSSKTYQWNATLAEYDIERPSDVGASDDTLDTYYETNGAGFSSAVSGSTSTSTGSGSIYLEKGRNLADLNDDATARTNLGVQIGLNVQGWDADLDDISALSSADGNFIVGSASGWTAESGDTARTSLGLGTGDSPSFTGLTVDGLIIEDEVRDLQSDVIENHLEIESLQDNKVEVGFIFPDLDGQALGTGDTPTFSGLTINGDIAVTGTVDGRNVSDDGDDLDELYTTIGLSALTSHEVDQLENIGEVTTISSTQWGYVGGLNQPLTTTSNVTFQTVTLNEEGNETDEAVRADRSLAIDPDADSVITFDLTGLQDLTSNRTWTPTIADHDNGQRGVLNATSQTIYGEKSFNDDIFPLSDIETTDFESWFDTTPTGWQISQSGVGDFRTLYIDELVAKAFTVDVAQALAGSDILTKSVAILAEDYTVASVGSTTSTIVVEDLEGLGGFAVFEDGDFIRMRIVNRVAGLTIGDVYASVTLDTSYGTLGYDSSTSTQRYLLDIESAGSGDVLVGQKLYKGAVILDYGTSGDYYIERTVLDRSSGSDFSKVPYNRIVQWTNTVNGSPDPSDADTNISVITQNGNLANLTSTYSNVTGFGFFGDNTFLTGTLLVGDLTKGTSGSGNYFEYNGTDLDIVTDSLNVDAGTLSLSTDSNGKIVLGTDADNQLFNDGIGFFVDGNANFRVGRYEQEITDDFLSYDTTNGLRIQLAGEEDELSTAIADLRSDLINIYLGNESTFAGIQFLAGSITLQVNDDGKVASARLDATGDVSEITLRSDFFDFQSDDIVILGNPDQATKTFTPRSAGDNAVIALGDDAHTITVANNESGFIATGAGEFKAYVDASNYIRFTSSSADIKVENFNLKTSFIQIANSLDDVLTSSVNYDTTSFDGLFFDADNYIGHIEDVDVVATSGFALRIGGNTSNFMEVNEGGGIAKINFDTFTLDTGSGSGIKIESDPDPLIELFDASRVRTKIDVTSGSPSISDTTELTVTDQNINFAGTDVVAYNTPLPYPSITKGDSIEVFVDAELTALSNADASSFITILYGGTSSTNATNEIARTRSSIMENVNDTTDIYLSGNSYSYTHFKIGIIVQAIDPLISPAPSITLQCDITMKSFESQTRVALDGVYVNNNSQQYARLTRDSNILGGLTILENIPNANPNISGAIYNDNGTLKIS